MHRVLTGSTDSPTGPCGPQAGFGRDQPLSTRHPRASRERLRARCCPARAPRGRRFCVVRSGRVPPESNTTSTACGIASSSAKSREQAPQGRSGRLSIFRRGHGRRNRSPCGPFRRQRAARRSAMDDVIQRRFERFVADPIACRVHLVNLLSRPMPYRSRPAETSQCAGTQQRVRAIGRLACTA